MRALTTLLGTVLVVAAEFVLLTGVYERAVPVSRAEVVVAALDGRLQMAGTAQTATLARQLLDAADQARSAGASSSSLAQVRRSAGLAISRPTDPAQLADLRQSVTGLRQTLANRSASLDLQAKVLYAMLLVVASIGWMIWFRRLVDRHRSLQRQLTEQRSKTVGEHRLAALIRNAADVVAVCDADSTVSFVTPSSHTVLGVEVADLVGSRLTDLVHPADLDLCLHLLASPGVGDEERLALRMTHADGRVLFIEGSLSNLLGDDAVGGLVLTMRDVTARRELEDRLSFQAFHDSLTGMANRQLFGDRLEHALIRRVGSSEPLVVLFCDLDDFKSVNDSCGHGIGDQVLVEVGARLRSVIRAGDTAARLGGDEFAILMDSADLDSAHELAQRVQAALAPAVLIEDRAISVRASIGLAQAVPGEMSAEEVLRNADIAMYLAKDNGKSGIAAYETRLHSEALERLELRADLQRALTRSELVLHYQPTIDLGTGAVVGFEALVRWQHPTKGLMGPLLFIPMAEESGLILPLGAWVLRAACAAAAGMQRPGSRPTMSVNVSAQQLAQPGFVDQVLETLAATGLASDRLVLEITETVVLRDLDTVAPRLAALRSRGIKVAIDDFGTGYSSLAYLSHLPIDVLKVDKSFVDNVTTDRQDASLAEAIISLSHSMNFTTVAEGVEHPEQASWLREAHCTYGQGYFWSRPVELSAAHQLLADSVAALKPASPSPTVFSARSVSLPVEQPALEADTVN
ncbi:MAG: EAL domain-containing protein [Actinomycetota bacterium]|nr:EAL domain-containing protein [Actinomycetota bacterium]MDQ2956161.1 EAL domain-containing protein [Actinomycetota bacterium]